MTSARACFAGRVHLVWMRWRALMIGGVLGLLFATLLIVGAVPAHAQSNAGAAAVQAPAGASAPLLQYKPIPPCGSPGQPACQPPTPPSQDLTGDQCTASACDDLVTALQQWTRWAAWLLGGFGVLWVLVGFYKSERTWHHIGLRVVEAGLIFLIAWRIGDIAQVIEGVLWANNTDSPQVNGSGLVGPPHQAIAQLLGLAMALIVQVFLLYQSPRIVFQLVAGVSKLAGAPFPVKPVLGALIRSIALGAAIFYAPTVLIWFFTFLAG